ncbi:MAG TPA: hypothetical protein VG817_01185 [Gemmatimonadales bacterium]|nr:hypothetical protein [Gemmatimonadales bacterium]
MRFYPAAFISFLSCAATLPLAAQDEADRPYTEDNSILIEEAYNQEFGVVQHISTFTFAGPRHRDLAFELTQEWPFATQRDQLSYTIQVLRPDGGSSGMGDLAFHYRRQFGMNGRPWALAPSISLILPTGDVDAGRGNGSVGVELGLPLSYTISRDLVTHWNASAEFLPWARTAGSSDRTLLSGAQLGGSLIGPMRSPVQLMLESLVTVEQEFVAPTRTESFTSWILSPAVRVAFNVGGLQLVPAFAVPMTWSEGERVTDYILYFSAEHAFRRIVD